MLFRYIDVFVPDVGGRAFTAKRRLPQAKLGLHVHNANVQHEGDSAVFCRKLRMPKIARRRPRRTSKENFWGHEGGGGEPKVSC
jgi:hypothetical protein